jgi:glycosyltransferase involved in cell wall biosynthesis
MAEDGWLRGLVARQRSPSPVQLGASAMKNDPTLATSPPTTASDGSRLKDAPDLRIAGVDPELGFAGGESQVLGLTLALIRAGHRADLICDPAGMLWDRARAAGVACHPLRIRNSVDLAAGLELRRYLANNHYDVVHFHTSRAHALAPVARGRTGVAVVTRRMDYAPNRLFAPWLFNRAVDGVAAISRAVADALVRSGVARDRVTIIPSGVNCEHFRPPDSAERDRARIELGLATRDIAIGAVGVIEARKGHRYLVEAMEMLRDRGAAGAADAVGPRVRCFIAGAGTLGDSLAAEIRAQRMAESIRLMGMIEDSRSVLWALDIFAMPSLQEGLGVAALEAMACGVPVIASATGGLVDAVQNERTGIHVPVGDARALADAIARLAISSGLRARMSAAARDRVVAEFAIEKMARATLALYRACLQDRARNGRQ